MSIQLVRPTKGAVFGIVCALLALCMILIATNAEGASAPTKAPPFSVAAPAPGNATASEEQAPAAAEGVTITPAALATANCSTGNICFWRGEGYTGTKLSLDGSSACCIWRYVSGPADNWKSAQNAMGNRTLKVGNYQIELACMDPGESRPTPGNFDRAKVGDSGGSCP